MLRSALAVIAVTAWVGAGCAKGPLPGRLVLPSGAVESVAMRYESGVLGGTGSLSTTLPDGESFHGPYRLDPRNPEHQMVSFLTGNRGTTMECRFKLNEPGVGPDGGGTMRCTLSNGGIIDGRF